jgi:ribonuclease HI
VKNRDLWMQVDRLLAGREIEWRAPEVGHPAAAELDRRVKEEIRL